MPEPKKEILLERTYSQYWTYILILIIPLFLASDYLWFQYLQSEIFSFILALQLLIITLIVIFHIAVDAIGTKHMNSTVNQQYPDNLNILCTVHDAFIIIHSAGEIGAASGLDNLIVRYKAKNYPFKIYHCYNPDEFKAVLANENAKYLWIFGHGWRGGIAFKWRVSWRERLKLTLKKVTIFPYCNLIENDNDSYPSKEFIAQLHCNNFIKKFTCNMSLPELIMQDNFISGNYHVSDRKHSIISIWFTTRELAKNIKRTPINPNEEMNIE